MDPIGRTDCLHCGRPEPLCICSAIHRVDNRTPVTIVQHPRERRHAFNTVRIAKLALMQVEVRIAWDIELEAPDLPADAALLYPGEHAELLGEGALPSHLVVIDGTWPQAKSLYKANPWLRELRHVALDPERPSAYAIRKEPAAHCLSSIESITAALQICEPGNKAIAQTLSGFHALIQGQLSHRSTQGARPRRPRRSKNNLLQVLAERWQDAVVVYAETTPLRGEGRGTEVLQLTAYRPATGERFDQLAQVRAAPNPCVLEHMLLSPGEVAEAPGFEALVDAWQAFARPNDVFLAWSDGGVRTAFACVGQESPVGPLKSLYCNLRRGPPGRPDQVLEREGVPSTPVAVRGRAGERLGNAAALAAWLRDRASPRR